MAGVPTGGTPVPGLLGVFGVAVAALTGVGVGAVAVGVAVAAFAVVVAVDAGCRSVSVAAFGEIGGDVVPGVAMFVGVPAFDMPGVAGPDVVGLLLEAVGVEVGVPVDVCDGFCWAGVESGRSVEVGWFVDGDSVDGRSRDDGVGDVPGCAGLPDGVAGSVGVAGWPVFGVPVSGRLFVGPEPSGAVWLDPDGLESLGAALPGLPVVGSGDAVRLGSAVDALDGLGSLGEPVSVGGAVGTGAAGVSVVGAPMVGLPPAFASPGVFGVPTFGGLPVERFSPSEGLVGAGLLSPAPGVVPADGLPPSGCPVLGLPDDGESPDAAGAVGDAGSPGVPDPLGEPELPGGPDSLGDPVPRGDPDPLDESEAPGLPDPLGEPEPLGDPDPPGESELLGFAAPLGVSLPDGVPFPPGDPLPDGVPFPSPDPESPAAAGEVGEPLAESPVDAGALGEPVPLGAPASLGEPVPLGEPLPSLDAGSPPAAAGAVGVPAPPRSGTVGAGDPLFPWLPDSIALCTPPAPALVKVSTPISRLKSCPISADAAPAEATCADRSAPNSVAAPDTDLVTNLLTGLVTASPTPPRVEPRPPPTAPPTAPPNVAKPRSAHPNLSPDRFPCPTWIRRAARSIPPSSSASKAAPRNAARAAAFTNPRVAMREINCLIAIRTPTCAATRAATPAAAPTPVHDVAIAAPISTAATTIVPMITSFVCSISLAPSSSSSACTLHHLAIEANAAWSPDSSRSRYVAIASWVSPADIADSAALNARPASSSTVSSVDPSDDHASAARRMAVSSPSGQSPAPRTYSATHCNDPGISIPTTDLGFGRLLQLRGPRGVLFCQFVGDRHHIGADLRHRGGEVFDRLLAGFDTGCVVLGEFLADLVTTPAFAFGGEYGGQFLGGAGDRGGDRIERGPGGAQRVRVGLDRTHRRYP